MRCKPPYLQHCENDCYTMTEGDRIALTDFEHKLHLLLHNYKELEKRNSELSALIEKKENMLQETKQRCQSLETNYNNLKQAKIITLGNADIEQSKEQLSRLVREIDRCIESLKK